MATNQVYDGDTISIAVTYPTTPASGGHVLIGKIPGVALTAERTDGTTTVALRGVFELAVKGEDGSGNAAVSVGDIVYVDTDGELNVDATNGTRFGYALAAVSSGATTTIQVLVGY